jgi:indolepyruvate ferredoxin oxidoreductase beta subunit
MIAALGGQGGGVVADWLIDVARRERHLVQATSVPGVAQRTGATFYYLEFFPETALPGDGRRPVMALMPSPGERRHRRGRRGARGGPYRGARLRDR